MRRRTAFTLVEVLVALALTLFILSILATAFVAATQSFTDTKAVGDLAERLRTASNVLRRDLAADHFTDSAQNSLRLSDPNLWTGGPPAVGFLRISQLQKDILEGTDLDGFPSYYQTTTALHYTVALHGSYRSDFLSAVVPAASPLTTPQAPPSVSDSLLGPPDSRYQDTPNVYNSPLAEVVVFLAPNGPGDKTDGSNGQTPLPLYGLYRRQFLAVPTGWTPPPPAGNPPPPLATQAPNYLEVSTIPAAPEAGAPAAANGYLTFNDMKALAMPIRRFSMDRGNPAGVFGAYLPTANQYATMSQSSAGALASADLLLSDVVSFDVRVLIPNVSPDFMDLCDPSLAPYFSGNPAFNQQNGPIVFDTWSNQIDSLTGADYSQWDGPWRTPATPATSATIPLYKTAGPNGQTISIQAIQITLRVWDYKTKKTRQVTIVQQM